MSEKVSSTGLKLHRLKHASEAYQEHKAIFTEYVSTGVDPETGIDEGDFMAEGFQTWPEFREQFLTDWTNNRRVVDEKEADVHFDNLADQALNELESAPVAVDVEAIADQVEANEENVIAIEANDAGELTRVIPGSALDTTVAPKKRRGRPPGKHSSAAKKTKVVSAKKKHVKVKQAAAKKKGGSKADQAREIIATWTAKGWARKNIIEKLMERLDMTPACASSYYQNYK